jgi:hypothetical protein
VDRLGSTPKCTNEGFVDDLTKGSIAETFARPIVERMYSIGKCFVGNNAGGTGKTQGSSLAYCLLDGGINFHLSEHEPRICSLR